MKIGVLTPNSRMGIGVSKLARKIGIPLNPLTEEIDCLVGILDGVLDAQAIATLLYKLNGREFYTGLAKPSSTGITATSLIIEMWSRFGRPSSVLLMLDQNATELEELWTEIEKELSKQVSIDEETAIDKRAKRFVCSKAGLKLNLFVVINGLDISYLQAHTIEDHLISIAKEELGVSVKEEESHPKDLWKSYVEQQVDRYRVFEEVMRLSEQKLRRYFPQHVKAIKALEER